MCVARTRPVAASMTSSPLDGIGTPAIVRTIVPRLPSVKLTVTSVVGPSVTTSSRLNEKLLIRCLSTTSKASVGSLKVRVSRPMLKRELLRMTSPTTDCRLLRSSSADTLWRSATGSSSPSMGSRTAIHVRSAGKNARLSSPLIIRLAVRTPTDANVSWMYVSSATTASSLVVYSSRYFEASVVTALADVSGGLAAGAGDCPASDRVARAAMARTPAVLSMDRVYDSGDHFDSFHKMIPGVVIVTLSPPRESVVDRFLRYVRIDTQSKEGASQTP